MKVHTEYLWFNTTEQEQMVRITDEVTDVVGRSEIVDGMVLVSAMHITAAVYVNDWESGLIEDIQEWLDDLPGYAVAVAKSNGLGCDRRPQRSVVGTLQQQPQQQP